ncbi:ABC transporter ATP-binding protein [Mesoplasma seiffertii]|uniref:ABC transporter ATP-binding protein n=1 Tax=Mesoplasma seiffertii TaxID=28224 RepID=UPI00047EC813|nr:ATP-binding cassette domain-containing protein [Mesoplasma seiffertii]
MKIEAKNLTKMFNKTAGIRNINLTIYNQQKLGILGPNGAGKTTLINLILGFLVPDKGEVLLNNSSNQDVHFNLNNVGYISTENNLPDWMSVKDFIWICRQLNKNQENNLAELSTIFEFDLNQKTKIAKLSTGMKQKLKICIALGFEKDCYIFDEPTNGLDPLMQIVFLNYVKQKLQNKTVIYCTHLVEQISEICDSVVIIKDNSILLQRSIDSSTNLKKVYADIFRKEPLKNDAI